MRDILRQMDISLFLLKLVGGFPYNKHHENRSSSSTLFTLSRDLNQQVTTKFEMSSRWKLMSVSVTLALIGYIALSVWSMTMLNSGLRGYGVTINTMEVIDDIVYLLTIVLLETYFLCRTSVA